MLRLTESALFANLAKRDLNQSPRREGATSGITSDNLPLSKLIPPEICLPNVPSSLRRGAFCGELVDVRYCSKTGKHVLNLSSSQFDPNRTWVHWTRSFCRTIISGKSVV